MRALKILNQRDEAIAARVEAEITQALGDKPTIASAIEAARRAHAAMDHAHEDALQRAKALHPACASGCSSCCHVHAYATAPELFAVLAFLRQTRDAAALQSLRNALTTRRALVEPFSDAERWSAKIPCLFLDEKGRCSIYEARPLRCRAFHSLSADVCRRAFEGDTEATPMTSPLLDRTVDAVERGYDAALNGLGLEDEGYRLEIALSILLEAPDAAARWLLGEDVFEPARGEHLGRSSDFSESE